jgi:hypothetical protein
MKMKRNSTHLEDLELWHGGGVDSLGRMRMNDENGPVRIYIPLKLIARLVVRQAVTCRKMDARQAGTCRRLSQPIAGPLAGARASVFSCRTIVVRTFFEPRDQS